MQFTGQGKLISFSDFSKVTGVIGANIEGHFDTGDAEWIGLATVADMAKPVNPEGRGFDEVAAALRSLKPGDHGDPIPRKERVLEHEGYRTEATDCLVLAVVSYYLNCAKNHGHRKICVQVHRGGQGKVQLAYLLHHLRLYYGDKNSTVQKVEQAPFTVTINDVEVEFRNGYTNDETRRDNFPCQGARYHISISHVIGFSRDYPTGTFLIPDRFGDLNTKHGHQGVSLFKKRETDNFSNYLTQTIGVILSIEGHMAKCAWITGYAKEGVLPKKLEVKNCAHLAQIDGGILDPQKDALVFVKE